MQPCATYAGQIAGRLTTGASWRGVTCLDQYTTSTPASASRSTLLGGGADLSMAGFALAGTLPLQLQELQTSVNINLQKCVAPSAAPGLRDCMHLTLSTI